MKEHIIALVDCDSFLSAVNRQLNPLCAGSRSVW